MSRIVFLLLRNEAKKIFGLQKNHSPPFKLNGWSLIDMFESKCQSNVKGKQQNADAF